MSDIFIFFGKDVRVVEAACDVFDFDEIVLNLFSNCVFTDLDVSYALCTHVVGPLDTRRIVIVNDNGPVCVVVVEAKVFEDVGDLL